jgi:hypothetical protein
MRLESCGILSEPRLKMVSMLIDPHPVGNLDLGDVPNQWRKLDFIINLARTTAEKRQTGVIDPRMVDESRPGGHRLYPQVERFLGAAQDCHAALPLLLETHGATQTAMWALLRAQFEAAFYALWLLEPALSAERVYRAVRMEWLDDQRARIYQREALEDPNFPLSTKQRRQQLREQAKLDTDHAATYGAECAQLGHPCSFPISVNVIDEINHLNSEDLPEQRLLLRHTWRSLAGLQHGALSALLRVSTQSVAHETPNGVHAQLAPSDAGFQTIAATTNILTRNAFVRYLQCHRPSNATGVIDLSATLELRQKWAVL